MKNKNDLTFKDFERFKAGLIETGNTQVIDIFTVLFYTGLRMDDVLKLKFSDIDLEANSITVDKKRSLSRNSIIINDECMETLRRLKKKYHKDVFVFQSRNSRNQKNKPAASISRQAVNSVFKSVSTSTSLPITVGSLRERYAIRTLKEAFAKDSGSVNLSKIMKHSTIGMTQHYISNCIKDLTCLSAPKAEIKPQIIKNILDIVVSIGNLDLDHICNKCDISDNDLIITLRTLKLLKGIN